MYEALTKSAATNMEPYNKIQGYMRKISHLHYLDSKCES
jgi:hypothetical protein